MIQKLKSFLLDNTSTRQVIAKNAIWLTIGQLLSRLVRAIFLIVAARILGTAGYGAFSYALGAVAMFTIFSDLGVSAFLTRELSGDEKARSYVTTSLLLRGILTGIGILIILILLPMTVNVPDVIPLIPIAGFLLVFESVRDLAFATTRARNRMEIEAGINVLISIVIVALGIPALFIFGTIKSVFLAYTIGSGVGFICALFILRPYLTKFTLSPKIQSLKKILRDSLPFAFIGAIMGILFNVDVLMLGWLSNASNVGLYAAAIRPITIIYVLPSILAAASFPALVKLVRGKSNNVGSFLERLISSSLLIGLPTVVGGYMVAGDFLTLLFGAQFTPAATTFQVLLITILLFFPSIFLHNIVFAYNEQKRFWLIVLTGAIANVFLNWSLIQTQGAAGAAIATLISQLLIYTLTLLKIRRFINVPLIPRIGKIFVATIFMALSVITMNTLSLPVVVTIAVAMAIYLLTLLLLREPLLFELREVFKGKG